jgi:hypothetical protein
MHPKEEEEKGDITPKMVPEKTMNSSHELSYFGKSMAEGDFKGDGSKELVVGAPGYTAKGLG